MVVTLLFAGQLEPAHAQSFCYICNAATGQVLDLPSGITSKPMLIQQGHFQCRHEPAMRIFTAERRLRFKYVYATDCGL
jgi:hypothetical protein